MKSIVKTVLITSPLFACLFLFLYLREDIPISKDMKEISYLMSENNIYSKEDTAKFLDKLSEDINSIEYKLNNSDFLKNSSIKYNNLLKLIKNSNTYNVQIDNVNIYNINISNSDIKDRYNLSVLNRVKLKNITILGKAKSIRIFLDYINELNLTKSFLIYKNFTINNNYDDVQFKIDIIFVGV